MRWPQSAGKGVAGYIEEAATRVTAESFEKDLREFLRVPKLEPSLNPEKVNVLFRISDEFLRIKSGLALMEKDRITQDWQRRDRLAKAVGKGFESICNILDKASSGDTLPLTSLLARSTRFQIDRLRRRITREMSAIKEHEALSKSMLQMLSKKELRQEYVGELDEYVVHAFRDLKEGERDTVIAGTMVAAKFFSVREVQNDVISRIPMMRARARKASDRDYRDVERARLWR